MFRNILAGVLTLLLAACAAGTPAAQSELAGTRWTLVSYGPSGAEKPVVAGSTVTLEFGANGHAGGSGGCNSYGGDYHVQGDSLAFSRIISTAMACVDGNIMQQEQAYFSALETASQYELAGEHLTIQYDGGQLNFAAA